MEGKPSILKEVVSTYLRSSIPLVTALHDILTANDMKQLQITTHSLKSSSANVGAIKLSELCKEIEMNCRNQKHYTTADLITKVKREFDLVKEILSEEINTL